MSVYLFVYGTLRRAFAMHSLMEEYFSFVCNAQAKGKLYYEGSFPAAVPEEGENRIQGELYKLKSDDLFEEAFEKLDEYEDVNDGLFKRELTDILAEDNSITAWIYWYNRSVENFEGIESGDILEYYNNQKIK